MRRPVRAEARTQINFSGRAGVPACQRDSARLRRQAGTPALPVEFFIFAVIRTTRIYAHQLVPTAKENELKLKITLCFLCDLCASVVKRLFQKRDLSQFNSIPGLQLDEIHSGRQIVRPPS